jgi:superfamily II DNA or RNA helicase
MTAIVQDLDLRVARPGIESDADLAEFLGDLDTGIQRREYQEAAFRKVLGAFRDGRKSTLLVLPTGTGKTVCFGLVARYFVDRLAGRVLILAHRGELLDQAAAKLGGLGVESVTEKADQDALRAISAAAADLICPREIRCVVGSVQTLHERRLSRWPKGFFDLIVVDEAHHAPADTYRRAIDYFDSASLLGVTATADRMDRTNLGSVFESVALEYRLDAAIRDGFLCRLTATRADVRVDLRGIRTTGGDFNQGDLEDRISAHLEPLVNATREKVGDRRSIVFTPDVGSANAFATALNQVGIPAQSVSGKSADRDRILRDFAEGKFQALCNCALLLEGYDNPGIAAVVLARPTKSRALLAQMIGRGTRIAPDKSDCLIVDFDWQLDRHDLVRPVELVRPEGLSERATEIARELVESGDAPDLLDALEYAGAMEELEQARARERAEREAEERRLRVSVRERPTAYAWRDFDPVGATPPAEVLGLDVPESWASRNVKASPAQVACLVKFGLDEPAAVAMSRRAASAHIDALIVRREKGLATYKQVRCLARNGMDPVAAREMSFDEASRWIDGLKSRRRGMAS